MAEQLSADQPRCRRIDMTRAQPSAYPRWYERIRAVAGIAVVNVVIGVAIAVGIGALLFLAAFAVELAISS
jgi:hypothetical protein